VTRELDPDLHAALESSRGRLTGEVARFLERKAAPLSLENGRLYAPNWTESYVDIPAVMSASAYTALAGCEKLVVDEPRPLAFAAKLDGAGYLVVSSGLIEFIAFCAYHAAVCGEASFRIGEDLDAIDDGFLQIAANFVEHGWPLLGDIEANDAGVYQTMVVNRDCMLLFVLLHELGHIVCGHLERRPVSARDFDALLPDLHTPSHAREIEADRFACDAIANAHVLFVASTFFSAWTRIQVSRRVRLGERAHLSKTHPLAVNRLHRIRLILLSRKDEDVPQMIAGLESDLRRCAEMISNPTSFGLEVAEYSIPEGRARHEALIGQYRLATAPYC
jgi:hypothetical protein